jgi:hypothetical protein
VTDVVQVLEGSEDFSPNPLFPLWYQCPHKIDGYTRLIDDVVNTVSQQMLLSTSNISAEMAALCDDLEGLKP